MRQATKDQIKRGAVAASCTVPSFAHGTGFLGRVSLSSSPPLFYNSCDVLNSIPFHLIPFNPVPFHSVPLHSVPLSACPQPWPSAVFWCIQPPLCLSVELSVAQVAKKMAEVRTDAVILLGPQGDMRGILTDHDVARYAFAIIDNNNR